MKYLFLSLLLLLFSINPFKSEGQVTISEARKYFWDMGEKKISAIDFFKSFKGQSPHDVVLMAYKGAAEAASAGDISGVMNKLEAFKRGKKSIEKAIETSPKNWEVRFIRFTTQMNAPSMLGYNNLSEDRKFFLSNRPSANNNSDDRIFFNKALSYLIIYGKFNDKEKDILTNHKKQL